MTRTGRAKTVDKAVATGRLRKAVAFHNATRILHTMISDFGSSDVVSSNAVLAAIAYADAVTVAILGQINQQDHKGIVALLREALQNKLPTSEANRLNLAQRPRPEARNGADTMSEAVLDARKAPAMNVFERYLTLWVALCIVTGVLLGQMVPSVFHALGAATVAEVNLPVAILVWLMIIPMLLKIDLAALGQVGAHWRGIAATVGVNWLVKPFSMALLGWLFIGTLFRPWLPADQIDSYMAGLILLAAAPCTAMVFVWSNLVEGEPHFTLSQVALNDMIMVVAFAPVVGLLLGLSAIIVP